MAQTQTKKLTPKQAQIKADQLLRGIDNNNAVIAKKLNENVQSAKQVRTLISSATAVPAQKPAPAPAQKAASKKPEAKKPAAKKPAAKKPAAKPAKPAVKASAKPAQKTAPKVKPPVKDRPPLKDVIRSIIAKGGGKPMGAAEIYRAAVEKYGYWSRQSLYNALKDTRAFSKVGDGFKPVAAAPAATQTSHAEEEADKFVQSVQGNQATSTVS